MEVTKVIRQLSNRWALVAGVVGLLVVVVHNLQRWRQDKAFLGRVVNLAPLPSLETWGHLPMVSVLVPAWNEAERIEHHIRSFVSLRYPRKELVLCAGGRDGTHDLASMWAGSQVVVLEQQPGEGKQKSLQHCLEKAMGEIVFLTDADCLLSDEAFERTIWPIVNEGEFLTTGTSRPLAGQLGSPFVRHRWFTDLYADRRHPDHIQGILGRNAALRRDVLGAIGEFRSEVKTGTDYRLAKQAISKGYRVRYVQRSAVETHYPEEFTDFWHRQTRWLRNVVMHGLRFGAYREVTECLFPSVGGLMLLLGPLVTIRLSRATGVLWLSAWTHVLLSRLRYMRFGELSTGHPFKLSGYLRLPVYTVLDFGTWVLALLQYPVKRWRSRW